MVAVAKKFELERGVRVGRRSGLDVVGFQEVELGAGRLLDTTAGAPQGLELAIQGDLTGRTATPRLKEIVVHEDLSEKRKGQSRIRIG